ncbi:MAG: hypothetical protein F6K19_37475 [Cyanothece sp. SIO1E1]|nr:hypothetical protein [Cyanothece sp. SIO1E1]
MYQSRPITTVLLGVAACVVLLPFCVKALKNGNLNLNGLALDFAEAVLEPITRRDINFGDPARVDQAGYQVPPGSLEQ